MSGRRILITGAAGFIGSNLVRRLLAVGHEIYAVVRPTTSIWRLEELLPHIHLLQADLRDTDAAAGVVEKSRPDIVVHLGSSTRPPHPRSSHDRLEALQLTVMGTAALLEGAVASGVHRFILVGSSLEYGFRPRPLQEADTAAPDTDRGVSRFLATELVRFMARVRRLHTVVVRPFSVYGPWEAPHRFIPTVIRCALTGTVLPLVPGPARHDWIHVDDVVELITRLFDAPTEPGEVFNAGTGRQWTNEQVIRMVEELTSTSIRTLAGALPPSPADRPSWVADPAYGRSRLGWAASRDLRTGLRGMINWWRDRLQRTNAACTETQLARLHDGFPRTAKQSPPFSASAGASQPAASTHSGTECGVHEVATHRGMSSTPCGTERVGRTGSRP